MLRCRSFFNVGAEVLGGDLDGGLEGQLFQVGLRQGRLQGLFFLAKALVFFFEGAHRIGLVVGADVDGFALAFSKLVTPVVDRRPAPNVVDLLRLANREGSGFNLADDLAFEGSRVSFANTFCHSGNGPD
jgi:hypothetical protein